VNWSKSDFTTTCVKRRYVAQLSKSSGRHSSVAGLPLGLRWFHAVGFALLPYQVRLQIRRATCQLSFDLPLAIYSLRNFPHIVLFAIGFVLTAAQFRLSKWRDFLLAAALIVTFGALVELLEGVTRTGNCRLRDLIPDTVGAFIGALVVLTLYRIGWRPRPTWSLKWRNSSRALQSWEYCF
jgi:VanZ like protein